ncbi:FAD-dependent oxidoreductase [Mycobacterium hodleri]|uniref:FAD-dependent oxidoreductase n=1 Tax=Mycolicibacterium hodleri TaxID=49897 RepID=UPI0021F2C44E|nr:cyclic nucleotide-binding domain-containing thioredoxin-disulfide reductase [Mycolicibacterium hodleri]MCV7133436.1 FAD-dependent oxidoreductase [Mycolicibacterium hodleri]
MSTTARTASPAQPTFTDALWERFRSYGTVQHAQAGTWLFRAGEPACDMLLVESGTVDIVRAATADSPEAVVAHYGPRQFSGEMNLLTGQATYLDARATDTAVIYRVSPTDFRRLMDTESDLSDLVLRALLARRQSLREGQAARSIEVLAGPASSGSMALRTYLNRQQLPHTWTDFASDIGEVLAKAADIAVEDLPAVLTSTAVIRQATPARLADVLGLSHRPIIGETLDVVVIGGGPAGLAAAVYGASEGLSTLLLDSVATGGQAATSSRIENYLGFTSGISGSDLTGRAVIQAQKFGARIATPAQIVHLDTTPGHLRVHLDDATTIDTHTILIATGARYRALPLPRWDDFEGAGIYYGATELEARVCGNTAVAVIGGANSAGQAALFLAERGGMVHLIVRGASLTTGMSSYLADRIAAHPAITVHTRTQVSAVDGDHQLRRITATTTTSDGDLINTNHDVCGLFCFIGAVPATDWLTGIALDDHGFILTDSRIPQDALGPQWAQADRTPMSFETSAPAVLAAGDVRAGSMKRVAAAVGEGASAISTVHALLTAART